MISKVHKTYIICQIIALVSFFTSIYWIYTNKALLTFDSAWYLENANYFYNRFVENGIDGFIRFFPTALEGVKAPLISVLPLPFFLLFGQSLKVGLVSNAFLVFIFVHYLYLLITKLFTSKISLASIIITLSMPLFIGLSHHYFTEYLLSTLVVAFIYYLYIFFDKPKISTSFVLGIVFGLGLLAKVNFPMYIFPPSIFMLISSIIEKKYNLKVLIFTTCSILFGFIIASTWYLPNLNKVFNFAFSASIGDLSKQYGNTNVFNIQTILSYLKNIIIYGISPLHFFFSSVIILFTLVKTKKIIINKNILIISSAILPTFLILLFSINKDLRYLLPILPYFSILMALIIYKLKINIFILYCAIPFFLLQIFFISIKPSMVLNNYYLYKFDSSTNWYNYEIVSYIYNAMQNNSDLNKYNIVAIEHPYLNANNLSFYSSILNNDKRPLFTSLGYGESSYQNAINRINSIKPLYIIFLKDKLNEVNGNFSNQTNNDVYTYILNNPDVYRLDQTFVVNEDKLIQIYKSILKS